MKTQKSNKTSSNWLIVIRIIVIFIVILTAFDLSMRLIYRLSPLNIFRSSVMSAVYRINVKKYIIDGDSTVEKLNQQLYSSSKIVRTDAVRLLADLKSQKAMYALINAYYYGDEDIKVDTCYMLAGFEDKATEGVLINYLEHVSDNQKIGHVTDCTERALIEMKSKKALPYFNKLKKEKIDFKSFIQGTNAVRILEGKDNEIFDDILWAIRGSAANKDNTDVITEKRVTILANKEYFVPGLLNIYFSSGKGWDCSSSKALKQIILDCGTSSYSYLKVALGPNNWYHFRECALSIVSQVKDKELFKTELVWIANNDDDGSNRDVAGIILKKIKQ
ncbi:MAG: hypothetical protein A2231_11590 [Candidatus Firestonebacteria bacterium RIFOXYA2_FULL_40_8]|nr:MAG: hypothetical protein A2231_11590 [Candidatus Firestonebacteria bacterium RIFOXYA2_FULL_40_8]